MDVYKIKFNEKVLLVGEGNFSFSVDFIKLNDKVVSDDSNSSILSKFNQVISTCYESNDSISSIKKNSMKFLKEKGVTVLHNVDATQLKKHSFIGQKTFNKIIFNFPHVGGKMKIHLNRKLLADFFSSAGDVLDPDGLILMILCDGQGGTGADKNKRQWNDSWKVVEMAAESNFILKNVFPFMNDYFPGFINVGYRSLQKGFNINNALVHIFKLSSPPSILNYNINEINQLFCLDEISTALGNEKIPKIYSEKISKNIFNLENAPLSYLYKYIKHVLFYIKVDVIDSILIYGHICNNINFHDLIKENLFKLKKMICMRDTINIFKGYLLNDLTSNFSLQPVSCEVIFIGNGSSEFIEKSIRELLQKFRMNDTKVIWKENNENCHVMLLDGRIKVDIANIFKSDKSEYNLEFGVIFLDSLAKFLFNLNNWQELWADGNQIEFGDAIKVRTPSLFPCSYTFDLSFAVQGLLLEKEFFKILWHLAGNMIVSVNLISVYVPPNKNVQHYCYRIKYKSYELPLHRKRVIEIQHNVIGKTFMNKLNVSIL